MNLGEYAKTLFSVSISDEQLQQFERFLEMLVEWNQQMNLTAISEPDAIRVRHFLDSLSVSLAVGLTDGMKVIDVGTGAGLPGLALHIAFPGLNSVLLDSTGKKIKFLNHVISELGLKNISAVHARAEDAAQMSAHRGKYDLVLARAVARLPILLEYLLPFGKVGGNCVAMKGVTAQQEVSDSQNALRVLGGKVQKLVEVTLPDVTDTHYLVVIEKEKKTPSAYPRKAGIPSRKPL